VGRNELAQDKVKFGGRGNMEFVKMVLNLWVS
jgi:hypothetical protein